MTFTVLAVIGGLAIGLVTGGRLRHLAGHQLRSVWLLATGVVVLAGSDRLAHGPAATVAALVGYGCLVAVAVVNPTVIGMGVVAVGLAANALVIGVNGGMPVHRDAVVAARMADPSQVAFLSYGPLHHEERPGGHLGLLDDRIPVPELHQVLSFGDLVLGVGVADVVAHFCHPRRRRRARPVGALSAGWRRPPPGGWRPAPRCPGAGTGDVRRASPRGPASRPGPSG